MTTIQDRRESSPGRPKPRVQKLTERSQPAGSIPVCRNELLDQEPRLPPLLKRRGGTIPPTYLALLLRDNSKVYPSLSSYGLVTNLTSL